MGGVVPYVAPKSAAKSGRDQHHMKITSEPIEANPPDEVNKTAEEIVQSQPLNDEVKRDGLSDNLPFHSNSKYR